MWIGSLGHSHGDGAVCIESLMRHLSNESGLWELYRSSLARRCFSFFFISNMTGSALQYTIMGDATLYISSVSTFQEYIWL